MKLSRIDILLLRYAAGSLRRPLHVVVLVILVFRRDARDKVREFEALGGRLIHEEKPTPVSPETLETVLKKIEESRQTQGSLRRILDLFSRF